ncbi:unnamed protein product [Paramecium octaurelia]|uniref:Uncharacterized protein n=1 Tax=Paramecium octaurelia TaxID=43137 RepID=A0A8S1UM25_PAROT|nr:unnamed protein product [Paramecium octaurelia]
MSFCGEQEDFDEIQNQPEHIGNDEQNNEIDNDYNNDSEIEQCDTIIENRNQQKDSNCLSQDVNQEQLNQTEKVGQLGGVDQLYVEQDQQELLLNLGCPLIQQLIIKESVNNDELEMHQECGEFLSCQFCVFRFTPCQYKSHLKQIHSEYFCSNCGIADKNITNQNHRLRCFQQQQFGFTDAIIQQLDDAVDENEIEYDPDEYSP